MRLTNRSSGRVTIKCMRPTVILRSIKAALRWKCGLPPLSSVVGRHAFWIGHARNYRHVPSD
jgi:hypothetical protein